MRFPRILTLQVTREIISWSVLGYVALVTILVSQNLIRRLDDLLMVGFGFLDLLLVLRSLLPLLTAYSMPVAFLFGVLVTMRRMQWWLGVRHVDHHVFNRSFRQESIRTITYLSSVFTFCHIILRFCRILSHIIIHSNLIFCPFVAIWFFYPTKQPQKGD